MLKVSRYFLVIAAVLMIAQTISADEPQSAAPTLKITNERICPGTISPYQYGQFIEYLCALTPSMFSEKLFDGSFEGVPAYRFAFRKETDRIEQPWYPDGATNRGEFQLDKADPFNGKVSQRIRQKPGDPATLGISQSGMYVKAGEPLRLSLHMRANDIKGPVKAAIWGEGKVYAVAEFSMLSNDWKGWAGTLTPTDSDTHATLTISFRGPGTLWIDRGLADAHPERVRLANRRGRGAEGPAAGHHPLRRQHDRGLRVEGHHRRPGQESAVYDLLGRPRTGQRRAGRVPRALPVGRRRAADLRAVHRQDAQGRRRSGGILQRPRHLADGQAQGRQRTRGPV